jgi:hypothetical protein
LSRLPTLQPHWYSAKIIPVAAVYKLRQGFCRYVCNRHASAPRDLLRCLVLLRSEVSTDRDLTFAFRSDIIRPVPVVRIGCPHLAAEVKTGNAHFRRMVVPLFKGWHGEPADSRANHAVPVFDGPELASSLRDGATVTADIAAITVGGTGRRGKT